MESLPLPVRAGDGSITWGSLTFPAGTQQLTWLQDMATGKFTDEMVSERIDTMAEKAKQKKEEEIRRRQNPEVIEEDRGVT